MIPNKRQFIPGWLIFVAFCFGFWPGLILLIIRIIQGASEDNAARRAQEMRERAARMNRTRTYQAPPSAGRTYQTPPSASRTYQPPRADAQTVSYRPVDEQPQAAPKAKTRKSPSDGLTRKQRELISGKSGKGMWLGGLITLGAGIFSALITVVGAAAGGDLIEGLIASSIVAVAVGIPGAVLTIVGNKNRNRAARCRTYQAMVGLTAQADLDELAAAIPTSYAQVRKDLEWMLDEGFFPGCYLDSSTRMLTHPGAARDKDVPKAAKSVHETTADGKKVFAEEKRIREINDRIDDEYISGRMNRLEELTHNILAYVDDHPEKEKDIRAFRAHYLPTTMKVLESYARFEKQGVEGENISGAMKDVESIMDKLVNGFEKQLDALYAAEAMDVSTDINVLDNMLNMEGFGPLSPFDIQRQDTETQGK